MTESIPELYGTYLNIVFWSKHEIKKYIHEKLGKTNTTSVERQKPLYCNCNIYTLSCDL